MREIKFRGYDGMEWIYGSAVNYVKETDTWYMIENDAPDDDWIMVCHVGQYTGLKDSKGQEIYEGDIVKYTEPNMGGYNDMTGVVEYMECGYWVNNSNTSSANPLFCETATLEIIGDAYEID